LLAIVFALFAVFAGMESSLRWDSPTGPSMVVSAAGLFFVMRLVKTVMQSRRVQLNV